MSIVIGPLYLNSTAIEWTSYDEHSRRMQIKFRSGTRVYDFCNVPESLFYEFINASSHGDFYHARIKDRYDCF